MLRTINRIKGEKTSCMICGKCSQSGNNKPHSLHKTKRVIRPNLQSFRGIKICTTCLKSIKCVN